VVNSLYHISAGISSFFGSPHFNTYILQKKFAAILRSKARFGLTSLHAVIALAGFPAAGNGDNVA
jgi:hypothetical protein